MSHSVVWLQLIQVLSSTEMAPRCSQAAKTASGMMALAARELYLAENCSTVAAITATAGFSITGVQAVWSQLQVCTQLL